MDERYYPDITEDQLWPFSIVKRQLEEDPDYLDDPECPYSGDIRRFFGKVPTEDSGETTKASVDDINFESEVSKLYKQLKEFGDGLETGDTSEKNTYFRLSVSLLKDILDLKERAAGLNHFKEFTDAVLQIMGDILTPDQRTRVMNRLRDIIGMEPL